MNATASALKQASSFLVAINHAWRNPEAHKRFQKVSGLPALLAINSLQRESDAQSGFTHKYHVLFRDWAINDLDLSGVMPDWAKEKHALDMASIEGI
jgi:hypothetical protein